MDTRYLRFFIVLAEELNFTRAAERLHTVQPSLSHQIHRLEEIVGVPLLKRTKHRVELTRAGQVFLEDSRRLVENIDRTLEHARRAAQSEGNELSIGFVSGTEIVFFPRMMPQLYQQHPDIELHLVCGAEPHLIDALQNRTLDAVFCAPFSDPELSAHLDSEIVICLPMLAILPSHHALASYERIPVDRLAAEHFIQPSPGKYPWANKVILEIAERAGVKFQTLMEADGAFATLAAVGSGLGVGLVPEFMLQALPPTVVARPLDLESQPMFPVSLAYRKGDQLPALMTFLAFLREFSKETGWSNPTLGVSSPCQQPGMLLT
jgi:LysR family hca operon transcriptional activator